MSKLFRILGHLNVESRDSFRITVIEYDILSETKTNFVVSSEDGHRQKRMVPIADKLVGETMNLNIDKGISARTWALESEINEGIEVVKHQLEAGLVARRKKLDESLKAVDAMDELVKTEPTIERRTYKDDYASGRPNKGGLPASMSVLK